MTPSIHESTQGVYKVWIMDAKGNSRPVSTCATLTELRQELTPELREKYVYVFKWTPQVPKGRYLWGCIAGRTHTVDLRAQVRDCLRS